MEIIEALLIGFGCAVIITNWQLILAQSLLFAALIVFLVIAAVSGFWFFDHPDEGVAVVLMVLAIISFLKIRDAGLSSSALMLLFLSLIAFVYVTLGFGYALIACVGAIALSDYLATR